jgi:hypothetical protein
LTNGLHMGILHSITLMEVSSMARLKSSTKVQMECFFCGSSVSADSNTRAVLCSRCTARLAGTPTEINKFPKREVSMTDMVAKQTQTPKAPKAQKVTKPTAGFGRGWHLRKEFTAPNGDRYSFGKLITVETK